MHKVHPGTHIWRITHFSGFQTPFGFFSHHLGLLNSPTSRPPPMHTARVPELSTHLHPNEASLPAAARRASCNSANTRVCCPISRTLEGGRACAVRGVEAASARASHGGRAALRKRMCSGGQGPGPGPSSCGKRCRRPGTSAWTRTWRNVTGGG